MSKETLKHIQAALVNCPRCRLQKDRHNVVFGAGDPDARIMIVGEAPGQHEDEQGVPFVGRAGGLLDVLLTRAGVTREECYIANILKCRPPGNRDPQPDEIAVCYPFLQRQIAAIGPRVLITLGRHATSRLSQQWGTMGSLLKVTDLICDVGRIPIVPLYHPAYLLRAASGPSDKAKALLQDTVDRLKRAVELSAPLSEQPPEGTM